MAAQRSIDVVVWGASGFTGRLVCEHVARDYKGKVNWAMAGRSQAKLEGLRQELSQQYGQELLDVPILLGDLKDPASLDSIAQKTRVVISTAGPFALHGTPVVEAAVRNQTHYVDITGEIPWVKSLLASGVHEKAAATGTRIVPCCGYDSIPFDMGAFLVSSYIKEKLGKRTARVVEAVGESKGGVSGGTIASGMNAFAEARTAAKAGGAAADSGNVYELLPPEARGADKEFWGVEWSKELSKWLGPFVMQAVNTRVVHRSNFFLKYGDDFRYQEAVATPSWTSAKAVQLGTAAIVGLMSQPWLHPLLRRMLPAPGEGPSRETMLSGYYNHSVLGWTQEEAGVEPTMVQAKVSDPQRDGGYWGTSRMLLEAALCLALQQGELDARPELQKGGLLTPASSMGELLLGRLRAAGIIYEVTEVAKEA